MARASNAERYMLRLINHERAQAGLDPLRFNGDLNGAAERHSEWMIKKDVFSHSGGGGTSPGERMQDAGYRLQGNWRTGENIALQSERGNSGIMDDVRDLHRLLMQSPEHRANILNPKFDEIGIGIERGMFRLNGNNFDAAVVTQDFGRTAANTARQAQAERPAVNTAVADQFVFHAMSDDATPQPTHNLFARPAEWHGLTDLADWIVMQDIVVSPVVAHDHGFSLFL
jgi:hypothetical protein